MAPESTQHTNAAAAEVLPVDEHNLDLLANTHPADYENPTPNNPYTWWCWGQAPRAWYRPSALPGWGRGWRSLRNT